MIQCLDLVDLDLISHVDLSKVLIYKEQNNIIFWIYKGTVGVNACQVKKHLHFDNRCNLNLFFNWEWGVCFSEDPG